MTKDSIKEFLFNPEQFKGTKIGIGFLCMALFTIIRMKVNNEAIITYILEGGIVLLLVFFISKIFFYNKNVEGKKKTRLSDYILFIITIILFIINTISVFQES